MSLAITAVVAVSATAAAVQYDQARDAARDQRRAQDAATLKAKEAARKADEDFNRMNMKKPNIAGIMAQNAQSSAGGVGSTMLTGPGGAGLSNSILGKTTLLGG